MKDIIFKAIILFELYFVTVGKVHYRDTMYLQNRYIMERHERECPRCKDLDFCNPYSEDHFFLTPNDPDSLYIRYFNDINQ